MAVCSPRLCSLRRRSFFSRKHGGHPTFIIRRWVQATPVIHDSLENATRQRGDREMGLRTCLHRAEAILPSLVENTESRTVYFCTKSTNFAFDRHFALQKFMHDCLKDVRYLILFSSLQSELRTLKLKQSYKLRLGFIFHFENIFLLCLRDLRESSILMKFDINVVFKNIFKTRIFFIGSDRYRRVENWGWKLGMRRYFVKYLGNYNKFLCTLTKLVFLDDGVWICVHHFVEKNFYLNNILKKPYFL